MAEGASLGRTYGAERRKDEKAGYAAAWENVPDRGKSPCKSGKLEARLVYLGKRKEACEAGEEERAERRVTGDRRWGRRSNRPVHARPCRLL